VYDRWTPGGVLISNQEDESAAKTNVYSLGNRIRIQFNSTSSAFYLWKISSVTSICVECSLPQLSHALHRSTRLNAGLN